MAIIAAPARSWSQKQPRYTSPSTGSRRRDARPRRPRRTGLPLHPGRQRRGQHDPRARSILSGNGGSARASHVGPRVGLRLGRHEARLDLAGQARVHAAVRGRVIARATHSAIAAFSACGGSAMNAASNWHASSAEHPSASSSAARSDPSAAAAHAANSSHTPSAEDTEPARCAVRARPASPGGVAHRRDRNRPTKPPVVNPFRAPYAPSWHHHQALHPGRRATTRYRRRRLSSPPACSARPSNSSGTSPSPPRSRPCAPPGCPAAAGGERR